MASQLAENTVAWAKERALAILARSEGRPGAGEPLFEWEWMGVAVTINADNQVVVNDAATITEECMAKALALREWGDQQRMDLHRRRAVKRPLKLDAMRALALAYVELYSRDGFWLHDWPIHAPRTAWAMVAHAYPRFRALKPTKSQHDYARAVVEAAWRELPSRDVEFALL
jgi:hypothetical protein